MDTRTRSSRWNMSRNVPGSLRPLGGGVTPPASFSAPHTVVGSRGTVQRSTEATAATPPDSLSPEPPAELQAPQPTAVPPAPPQPSPVAPASSEVRRESSDADNSSPDSPATSNDNSPPSTPLGFTSYRDKQWSALLNNSANEVLDLEALKKLSWNGVPGRWRPTVWQLLLGYLPSDRRRRAQTLARKRREYAEAVAQHFDLQAEEYRTLGEQKMLRQILVDVPRLSPDVPLFHQQHVQRCLERLLFVWAVRHPATGYVQGMDDLATSFFVIFLSAALVPEDPDEPSPLTSSYSESGGNSAGGGSGSGCGGGGGGSQHGGGRCPLTAAVETMDAQRLKEESLSAVEADTYWCLTKLLDNIQDHYTAGQPGLQRQMYRLEELVRRIDPTLHGHLAEHGIQFSMFSFRWMNNLLMRELPLQATIRLWDTCLAEDQGGNGFEGFFVFVSAAFLRHFSSQLCECDGEGLMTFLQELPTSEWGPGNVETLLSEAFILSTLYRDAPSHLTGGGGDAAEPAGSRSVPLFN